MGGGGLGFRVWGLGFGVWGLGFRALDCKVPGDHGAAERCCSTAAAGMVAEMRQLRPRKV